MGIHRVPLGNPGFIEPGGSKGLPHNAPRQILLMMFALASLDQLLTHNYVCDFLVHVSIHLEPRRSLADPSVGMKTYKINSTCGNVYFVPVVSFSHKWGTTEKFQKNSLWND